MKRSELFFDAVLLPLDYATLLLAAAGAYFLRVSSTVQAVRPAVFELDLPFITYMQLAGIFAAVIVAIFALQGLYAMQVTRRLYQEFSRIVIGISLGFTVMVFYMFLRAELFQSRFIVLAAYLLAVVLVVLGRYIVRRIQITSLRQGYGVHRVALVGNGPYGEQLASIFKRKPELGYRVVGMPEVVRWDVLEELQREYGVDEMIQTDPGLPEEDNLVLLDFCDKYKIDFKYIPNLFEAHAANVRFREVGGVPVMVLERTPLDGWGRVTKRIMDIGGALFGLAVLSPVLVAAAVAIKLDSAGPVFYKQTRVGRKKKSFKIYKFRSMKLEYSTGENYGGEKAQAFEEGLKKTTNERQGPLFKMRNDPRITRVGRFIRRWRVDELPQFINVLHGEMSLIGPRPHLPEEVARYDKHQEKLFTIKPGMSGMAQVNGNAGLSFEQEASMDVGYIENWSLRLDIILLLKTFLIMTRDKNAI